MSTPAWEANDEPDHVRNVQTLASGHWYRIEPGAGFESHQAPLYYALLAGYQKALGVPAQTPAPRFLPIEAGTANGIMDHATATDGADQRRVVLLRLPSILLGVATILLTALAGRRLSADPWTPVVAAALVAGVPKFAFLSGVVNNDNLSNTVGALGVVLVVLALGGAPPRPASGRRGLIAAALGATAGLLLITKLSAATVIPVLALAALLGADRGLRIRAALWFAGAFALVGGWWLVQNQVRYGDPVAATATTDHLRALFPPLFDVDSPARQIFVHVPQGVWRSFWYSSGWNQFQWSSWVLHLPLWIALTAGPVALVAARRHPLPAPARTLAVLALYALAAFASIWILGVQTTQTQARIAFFGLPALALLFAAGLERARVVVPLRFALPAIGFLGACAALQRDVLGVYF